MSLSILHLCHIDSRRKLREGREKNFMGLHGGSSVSLGAYLACEFGSMCYKGEIIG